MSKIYTYTYWPKCKDRRQVKLVFNGAVGHEDVLSMSRDWVKATKGLPVIRDKIKFLREVKP